MEGKRFIHRLKLTNLLSFGPEGVPLELEPLNVLIGPNASGKSNFIEAISLLQAAPYNLARAIDDGGGVSEWLWKGPRALPALKLETIVAYDSTATVLKHVLALGGRHTAAGWRTRRDREAIGLYSQLTGRSRPDVYDSQVPNGPPMPEDQSVLSQLKDPQNLPEITYLGREYGRIQLYREWAVGAAVPARQPQRADQPNDFLLPSTKNVGVVLSGLERRGLTDRVTAELQRFYPPVTGFFVLVEGGTVQVFVRERGLTEPVPAARLSDGTLRYLCLLTILCHPEPPPLVCIEEPELGLHPDIIPRVAELLVEASSRTQLVVTTHSSELVDALSDTPEAVVVCERDEGGTRMERLDPKRLREWLAEYTLGHLWMTGHLGGTR